MIALRCARCGHQVEVDEAAREREITCPRCGQLVSSNPAAEDAVTVAAKPFTASAPDFATEPPTHKEPDNEETISPHSSGVVEAFSFLSPAQGPNEMGWLAHYRVMRLLGQGGMGIVFEAIDMHLQRPVALKVMKPDIAKDESARQRFLREARVTASVKSDHVVVIHQVDQNNDVPFLAMEFLHGEPLDRWLERHGRPSLEETLRIGMEIARGLAAAHELGLIHRDIKPANIWLETTLSKEATSGQGSGTEIIKETDLTRTAVYSPRKSFRVKILDFGLARIVREKGHLTQTGLVLGTPAYMAPEQAEGGEVDARCDLFSLGCVLYELATGAKPFSGTNTMAVLMAVAMRDPLPPLELNPDLPPALGDVILRLLAKKPHDRPATAHEVVASLQSIADALGITGQTPTSGIKRGVSTMGARPVVPPKRRKLMIGLGVLGCAVAIGLVSWLCYALLVPLRNDEIVLGMSGPLQGPSKELGLEMEIGIKTFIKHINEKGGVHGRRLRLDPHDDGYEPDKALENMQRFHERNVFAVIGNIGTPTAIETVPYAVKNKMLFFGAFTGANILRRVPPDRYVFNYRASYEEETAKIVEYLVEIKKIAPDQIAVFDQNDAYGDAGFNGVVKVMRDKFKRDKKDIIRVRYTRNRREGIPEAVQTILTHKELRAVVMVGTYGPVTEFISRVKDANRDLIFTNVSFVGSEALAGRLKELGDKYTAGVIVTQVVPPIESSANIVLKYKEDLRKYYPNALPTFTSLEGYINTSLFVEGLKRAGRNATPEDVINALETIDDFDLGTGAPLTFSSSRHQASHTVWATVLDKQGKFQVLDMTE